MEKTLKNAAALSAAVDVPQSRNGYWQLTRLAEHAAQMHRAVAMSHVNVRGGTRCTNTTCCRNEPRERPWNFKYMSFSRKVSPVSYRLDLYLRGKLPIRLSPLDTAASQLGLASQVRKSETFTGKAGTSERNLPVFKRVAKLSPRRHAVSTKNSEDCRQFSVRIKQSLARIKVLAVVDEIRANHQIFLEEFETFQRANKKP